MNIDGDTKITVKAESSNDQYAFGTLTANGERRETDTALIVSDLLGDDKTEVAFVGVFRDLGDKNTYFVRVENPNEGEGEMHGSVSLILGSDAAKEFKAGDEQDIRVYTVVKIEAVTPDDGYACTALTVKDSEDQRNEKDTFQFNGGLFVDEGNNGNKGDNGNEGHKYVLIIQPEFKKTSTVTLVVEGQHGDGSFVTLTGTSPRFGNNDPVEVALSDESSQLSQTDVTAGTELSLTIPDAAENWKFVSAKDQDGNDIATDSTDNATFVMPDKDVTVTVTYAQHGTLTLQLDGEGGSAEAVAEDVTLTTAETGLHSGVVPNGTNVTITLNPAEGWQPAAEDAVRVVNDNTGEPIEVSGSGSTYTFTMPEDSATITVKFERIQLTVNLSVVNPEFGTAEFTIGGKTVDTGKQTIPYGETVTISATPNERDEATNTTYRVASVTQTGVSQQNLLKEALADGKPVANLESQPVVSDNTTIAVVFADNQTYYLTIEIDADGDPGDFDATIMYNSPRKEIDTTDETLSGGPWALDRDTIKSSGGLAIRFLLDDTNIVTPVGSGEDAVTYALDASRNKIGISRTHNDASEATNWYDQDTIRIPNITSDTTLHLKLEEIPYDYVMRIGGTVGDVESKKGIGRLRDYLERRYAEDVNFLEALHGLNENPTDNTSIEQDNEKAIQNYLADLVDSFVQLNEPIEITNQQLVKDTINTELQTEIENRLDKYTNITPNTFAEIPPEMLDAAGEMIKKQIRENAADTVGLERLAELSDEDWAKLKVDWDLSADGASINPSFAPYVDPDTGETIDAVTHLTDVIKEHLKITPKTEADTEDGPDLTVDPNAWTNRELNISINLKGEEDKTKKELTVYGEVEPISIWVQSNLSEEEGTITVNIEGTNLPWTLKNADGTDFQMVLGTNPITGEQILSPTFSGKVDSVTGTREMHVSGIPTQEVRVASRKVEIHDILSSSQLEKLDNRITRQVKRWTAKGKDDSVAALLRIYNPDGGDDALINIHIPEGEEYIEEITTSSGMTLMRLDIVNPNSATGRYEQVIIDVDPEHWSALYDEAVDRVNDLRVALDAELEETPQQFAQRIANAVTKNARMVNDVSVDNSGSVYEDWTDLYEGQEATTADKVGETAAVLDAPTLNPSLKQVFKSLKKAGNVTRVTLTGERNFLLDEPAEEGEETASSRTGIAGQLSGILGSIFGTVDIEQDDGSTREGVPATGWIMIDRVTPETN